MFFFLLVLSHLSLNLSAARHPACVLNTHTHMRASRRFLQCGPGGCGPTGSGGRGGGFKFPPGFGGMMPGMVPPGMGAGGRNSGAGNTGNFMGTGNGNDLSNATGNPFLGGGQGRGFSPDMARMVEQQLRKSMPSEVQEAMRNAMADRMKGGGQGGKIGMMAFGEGVNEKGKRVARGAKMEFDMSTGKMTKDFHEKQLDPDDPQLPRETVGNYDTTGAIEVDVDAPPSTRHQQQHRNRDHARTQHATPTPDKGTSSRHQGVREAEIIEEIHNPDIAARHGYGSQHHPK